jgi:hypothetical protein
MEMTDKLLLEAREIVKATLSPEEHKRCNCRAEIDAGYWDNGQKIRIALTALAGEKVAREREAETIARYDAKLDALEADKAALVERNDALALQADEWEGKYAAVSEMNAALVARVERADDALTEAEDTLVEHYMRGDSAMRVRCPHCGADDFFIESLAHRMACPIGYVRSARAALNQEPK